MSTKIGIIGGSGLGKMGIIKDTQEIEVNTPFGAPSEKITIGTIEGVDIAFYLDTEKTIPYHLIK